MSVFLKAGMGDCKLSNVTWKERELLCLSEPSLHLFMFKCPPSFTVHVRPPPPWSLPDPHSLPSSTPIGRGYCSRGTHLHLPEVIREYQVSPKTLPAPWGQRLSHVSLAGTQERFWKEGTNKGYCVLMPAKVLLQTKIKLFLSLSSIILMPLI